MALSEDQRWGRTDMGFFRTEGGVQAFCKVDGSHSYQPERATKEDAGGRGRGWVSKLGKAMRLGSRRDKAVL
jgi:hypothetical protein